MSQAENIRQKTEYEGSHPTIYYDRVEEYNAYQLPCRVMIMGFPLAQLLLLLFVYLTLTYPLRIQPWSQDRRNQTKNQIGNRR